MWKPSLEFTLRLKWFTFTTKIVHMYRKVRDKVMNYITKHDLEECNGTSMAAAFAGGTCVGITATSNHAGNRDVTVPAGILLGAGAVVGTIAMLCWGRMPGSKRELTEEEWDTALQIVGMTNLTCVATTMPKHVDIAYAMVTGTSLLEIDDEELRDRFMPKEEEPDFDEGNFFMSDDDEEDDEDDWKSTPKKSKRKMNLDWDFPIKDPDDYRESKLEDKYSGDKSWLVI